MKHFLILIAFLFSCLSFGQSEESITPDNFWWIFILTVIILIGLYYVIAIIEGLNKQKDKVYSSNRILILYGFLAQIIFAMIHLNLESSFKWIVIIGLKLLFAFHASKSAKELNRGKILWFILGFVEVQSALTVLGLVPKLLGKSNSDLNMEFEHKKEILEKLKKSNQLTASEYDKKIEDLKNEYKNKQDSIEETIKKQVDVEDLELKKSTLDEALKIGAITQEEYDLKVQEINNL